MTTLSEPRIAVLVPCYNEEKTIGDVVRDFRKTLPGAQVYVYDNNSKDATWQVAEAAGARVRRESMQGKGWVVRRMFADIDADPGCVSLCGHASPSVGLGADYGPWNTPPTHP